jgi:4-hydroxybenzoate polyprenyltransferase
MRPRQWLKNISLFAAVAFGGELFNASVFYQVIEAFFAFSLLSSSAYIFNDITDRKRDRNHPLKKERPIAKGAIPVAAALPIFGFLAIGSLAWIFSRFNQSFFILALVFIILQLSYSLLFRNVIILDAMVVAMAFVIRVYAGAFIIPTPISSWLILAVIGLALLLAFGKRRSERTLLSTLHHRLLTRRTLRHYPDTLLDSTISMAAAFTAISYAIFAFQTSPMTPASQLTALIPPTLANPKWMMLTIPLVIYGVARYLYVIYEKKEGESPEKVIITDFPLLGTVLAWAATVLTIIYGLGGS